MKITISCVGKLKNGPERELFDRYYDRCQRSFSSLGLKMMPLVEFSESSAKTAKERQKKEGAEILSLRKSQSFLILLDEKGQNISSKSFAQQVQSLAERGVEEVIFVIGGPDGHGDDIRSQANLQLNFGAMTWPHQLVRVLLAEQLYRTATILSGHPYHRQ